MRSLSVRTMATAAALATAALTVTACSDSSDNSEPAGSSVSVSAAPSESASGSSSGGSSGTSAPDDGGTQGASGGGPSSSATASGGGNASAASGACASGQLSVALKDAEVGAGQYNAEIVFTNTGSTSCTMTGFPGVSYVKKAGVQAGPAADRDGAAYGPVTLAPHATASAQLHDSNGQGGYDPGQCKLTDVEGLRIYPPNQKAALFLPHKTEHCAGTGIHPLRIGAVQR
ncbi:DUF4232 domain-containing protein [Actinacidiphila alni]|uniref:DUF4232 domain-containing protein n=1 Tax=Actinacidiphila alni TaxID=380248 RepID=UPI003454991F